MIRNFVTTSRGFGQIETQIRLFIRNYHRKSNCTPIWGKPDVGWIKLNFDGSSKLGTGKASIGGAYRNDKGVFVYGYAESIGKATSSVAELVAAKRGLELALKNGWLNIWLEGDAKVVIDLLMNGITLRSEKDFEHGSEINRIVPQLKEFKATHIFRQGNKVADKLAKMGHQMAKPRIWRHNPPKEVLELIRRDAEGNARKCKRYKIHD